MAEQSTDDGWQGELLWSITLVVGNNVRSRRERMNWTQAELGRQLARFLGSEWTRQQVSSAEKGARAFTAAELAALAFTLHTVPAVLFQPPPGLLAIELAEGHPVAAGFLNRPADGPPLIQQAAVDADIALARLLQLSAQSRLAADEIARAAENLHAAVTLLRSAGDGDAS